MIDVTDFIRRKVSDGREALTTHIEKIAVSRGLNVSVEQVKKVGDYVLALPNLVLLVGRVTLDSRVPTKARLFAAAIMAYVVSPIDIIPDIVSGPIGYLDDLIIVVFGLNMMMKVVDPNILREHWRGSEDLFSLIGRILDSADLLLPKKIMTRIENWLTEKGGELMVIDKDAN